MQKYFSFLAFMALSTVLSCKSSQDTTACINPAKVNPDVMCTMQYDPVCGCDNKTYSNACMANKAGVTSYTKGDCADKKSTSTGE